METDPVIVQCSFNATSEAIWKALTDTNEMKSWYFDIKEFKAIPNFEFSFTAGSKDHLYTHLCKITAVEPLKKLAYSWKYKDFPGASLVTFDLSPDGKMTKVTVTHEGLDSFPPLPDFNKTSFEKGWTEIICTNLKIFLQKKNSSHTQEN